MDHMDQLDRLRAAVRNLYYAAHWTPDRDVDADALWEEVRDAAGFIAGNAPQPRHTKATYK